MSQGLPETCENKTKHDIQEESETDSEYRAINPPVKNVKKTLQKRRKMKAAKVEQLQQRERRLEKKKLSDIYR
jgi:Nop53 (60S ribosomal biogenesis).